MSELGHTFDRLTLDGEQLTRTEAIERFAALTDQRSEDRPWATAVVKTLLDLGDTAGLHATTSGTTGPPKQFTIPRADLLASARLTAATFGLRAGDRALHCLPSDFVAGKLMLVRGAVLGLDLHVIDPRGSVLEHLRTPDRFRFAAMVPLQLLRALKEDRTRVEDQFETILLGGGPVSQALIDAVQGLRTTVHIGYGSTETVTHVALRTLNGAQRGEAFNALGEVTFGRDPRGCLVVYTPHLSVPQHVTNDLAEIIDDTHFLWLGRFDNVILSGGKKIFPEQLEAKTAGVIPYAHYFASTPDERLGQAVLLVLECPKPEAEVMSEVMPALMSILHPHELPRKVRTVPIFERTSGGKVIRR
ncbi:MAG TPA: AMP-binding protein [Flavobacteriales bacterium]|nr:AMP-binding protein [Flavobacteriales bacterium]